MTRQMKKRIQAGKLAAFILTLCLSACLPQVFLQAAEAAGSSAPAASVSSGSSGSASRTKKKTSQKTSTKKKSNKRGKKKNPGKSSPASSGKKGRASAKKKEKTGFVKSGSRWYWYSAEHRRQTGWIEAGGKRYYGKKTAPYKGSLLTGWQTIAGKEYYFSEQKKKGRAGMLFAGGTKKVNGISCRFASDGEFLGCRYAGRTNTFVNRVGEMARDNQRRNNILASVVAAQAILETGYGSVKPHNNLFGLYGGRYRSEKECMEAYNAYIRRYFPSLIGCMSYHTYTTRIGNGGYAQAGGYGPALRSIIRRDNLTRFSR